MRPVDATEISEALAGQPTQDRWWWQRLACRHAFAATTADNELLGAAGIGEDTSDNRFLLWLHAREDRAVIDALLEATIADHPGPLYAFWFATTLGVALEGLPSRGDR